MAEQPQKRDAEEEAAKKTLRQNILRMVLTSDARDRLNNVKMVKPEVAETIEDQIIQLATSGKLKRAITDQEVKQFLAAFQQPPKEFKIRWV